MPKRSVPKTGWTRFRFDEIAINISERAEPGPDDNDSYVGLEHLDSGSLRVRRWGSDVALKGTKLRMRAGDILFAKRNAYLKRVAIAPHDGLFSAHGLVLRAKPRVVLPEFLPFFMQSDLFMERALSISVGSLSPTINWKALAAEEFLLPPIQEQARLVEALSASEAIKYSLDAAIDALTATKAATENEVISRPLNLPEGKPDLAKAKPEDGWRILTGQDLLDFGYLAALQDGNHGSQYPTASELGTVGYPYLSATDITDDGEIDLASCRRIRPERADALRIPPAQTGDIVLSHNATVGRVTRLPEWPTPIVASTSTTYYRCNSENLDPDYLRWFLESSVFKYQLSTIMRQSTRNQVPITTQKRLLFAVPDRALQAELSSLRDKFVSRLKALQKRKASAQALQKIILEVALV